MRNANIVRKTKETEIECELNLDGEGIATVDSGIGFFDHMLNTFAKHGGFDLRFKCVGDLKVDTHHSVEDSGIVLGQAFYQALKDRIGISRYQSFILPMDDALVLCSVDICNRFYYEANVHFDCDRVGEFETETTNEFFKSFAEHAKINLHFVMIRGTNAHHMIEAMFKSMAKCLKDAIVIQKDMKGSLTTKGVL